MHRVTAAQMIHLRYSLADRRRKKRCIFRDKKKRKKERKKKKETKTDQEDSFPHKINLNSLERINTTRDIPKILVHKILER